MPPPPLTINSTIKLPSGHHIPRLGYGVYQARGRECTDGVTEALRAGYRHVDSAQAYRNEDLVKQGVENSGVPRKDVFLTTKYMATHKVYPPEAILKYLRPSLSKLSPTPTADSSREGEKGEKSEHEEREAEREREKEENGYIDLMLIHSPFGGDEGRANNWEGLVRAQKEGWVRDIGVSNFGVKHLEALPPPKPAINQIELHPWCQQRPIVEYCQSHGIIIQAYSPLVRADPKRFKDPTILRLCEKHGKDPAQILIRWSLQKGYVPLPKSVKYERIRSNADVYDFELDEEDMNALDGLDEGAKGAVTWNPVDHD